MPDLPRYVPDEPLPPYAYVPGRFPHPLGSPAGHSYGQPLAETPPINPAAWRQSRAYLYGCDLFNHGYYWEAHETWEGLWKAAGRLGTTADLLKGLIKLAAAGVKAREGRAAGVARHATRAAALFDGVMAQVGEHYLGLDLRQLHDYSRQIAQEQPTDTDDASVRRVFSLVLVPSDD